MSKGRFQDWYLLSLGKFKRGKLFSNVIDISHHNYEIYYEIETNKNRLIIIFDHDQNSYINIIFQPTLSSFERNDFFVRYGDTASSMLYFKVCSSDTVPIKYNMMDLIKLVHPICSELKTYNLTKFAEKTYETYINKNHSNIVISENVYECTVFYKYKGITLALSKLNFNDTYKVFWAKHYTYNSQDLQEKFTSDLGTFNIFDLIPEQCRIKSFDYKQTFQSLVDAYDDFMSDPILKLPMVIV